MKAVVTTVVLFVLAVLAAGCASAPQAWKSAQEAYNAGDMVKASQHAIMSLRQKPNFPEALTMLSDALPKAYEYFEQSAKKAEETKDFDNAHALYTALNNLSNDVSTLPPQRYEETNTPVTFPTRDVSKQIEMAARNAAESHYQAALSFEKQGKFKEAAKEFTEAQKFVPNYKDAASRYDKSRTAAIKRIAVMPFENKSGKTQYGEIGDAVTETIISEAMADPKNLEFMELVNRERLNQLLEEQKLGTTGTIDPSTAAKLGKMAGIHAFVFGKVNSVIVGAPSEKKTNPETVQRKFHTLAGERTYTALFQKTTRRATAKVNCSYQIVDVTKGTIVKSGSLPIDEEVVIEFARYEGQEDALDDAQRQLASRPDTPLPVDEELVSQALQKAAKKLAAEITALFR
jgi:TolB-like protein